MNHKTKESQLKKELLRDLKAKLSLRKYRADLKLITTAKNTSGTFHAIVKFNPDLRYPSEEDLMSIVGQSYPSHQIDWGLVDISDSDGVISLTLGPKVEVIPLKSLKEIPSEFISVGTGLYKRAADASGNAFEIWEVKQDSSGNKALVRREEDLEVEASEDDGFKAGDVVQTPYGPGRIKKFDDFGNAFVQVGNTKHLISAADMKEYSIDKERAKLIDYYTEAYGDSDLAKELCKKMDKPKLNSTPWLDSTLGLGKKKK
jgi:hypothetical protein